MNLVQAAASPQHRLKLVIGIVIVVAAGFLYSRTSANKNKQPQYQTGQVSRGTLVVSLSASGQVSSVDNSPVNTQSSGVVTAVYVHNGDHVKAGQKIAQISPDNDGKARATSAYASYLSASSALKADQATSFNLQSTLFADWQKYFTLATNSTYQNADGSPNTTNRVVPEFTTAQTTWLGAEAAYKNQQAVTAKDSAALSSAQLTYQQASPTIVAPIDGVIDGLSLEKGEVITQSTSSNTSSNTPSVQKVATMKSSALPLVSFNLTEIDIPKVVIGDRATVTFDAFPDKTFTGHVTSIDSSSLVSSGVTTYPTVIQLDTEVPGLYTNMSASANIITQTKDNVLLVPAGAVQTQSNQSFVRELQNGKLRVVPIQVGVSSDTQTEVTSGLSEGDTIVTGFVAPTGGNTQSGASPFSRTFGGGGGGARVFVGGRGG